MTIMADTFIHAGGRRSRLQDGVVGRTTSPSVAGHDRQWRNALASFPGGLWGGVAVADKVVETVLPGSLAFSSHLLCSSGTASFHHHVGEVLELGDEMFGVEMAEQNCVGLTIIVAAFDKDTAEDVVGDFPRCFLPD
jgi:hypothetical protein